ncbi:MAG TPA: PilZ domain-containing protein [Pyrinomonadaceae bacterium]|jgi:hypothetical protein
MPELVRSIASRLRAFVGNRRRARRYRATLPATVALSQSKAKVETANATVTKPRLPSLTGETCDISETGLAIIVPAIRIGEHYLSGNNRGLDITLELPNSTSISLRATPMRYEQLEREGHKTSYIIGARITEMSDDDRRLLTKYLDTLKK